MSRITCTSASARAISARPATSSGREVSAVLMAAQAGIGCANASGTSAGTGRSASRARLVLSIASAPRTSPTSAFASASSRATSTSARSTSAWGAVPPRVPCVRRGHDVAREADLLGRPAPPSGVAPAASGTHWRPARPRRALSGSRPREAGRHPPARRRDGGRGSRTTESVARS